jgi:hypothetical protein
MGEKKLKNTKFTHFDIRNLRIKILKVMPNLCSNVLIEYAEY